jgi:pilus assembly protein CpaE
LLRLALFTPNGLTANGIEQLAQDSGAFRLVLKGSPLPATGDAIRSLHVHNPDLILLDLSDWNAILRLASQIQQVELRGVTVGFRPPWTAPEQAAFEQSGVQELLREPFSVSDLEATAYEAVHRKFPVSSKKVFVFLPAKAGGGCSTVVLNTAGALGRHSEKKVLVIEADRRSGVLSILLNLPNRSGLTEALEQIDELTDMEWRQLVSEIYGIHLLPANPARRGRLASWADYYQILRFAQSRYEYVLVDMPEVINTATAEFVRCARGVFIVCEPEVPSLRLASQRCSELEACEISRDAVQVVINRWERGRVNVESVEKTVGRPVFAKLPNDYSHIKDAALESRLVSPGSSFGRGCEALAKQLTEMDPGDREPSKLSLLRKLARLTG